jgi:hypothetical protein
MAPVAKPGSDLAALEARLDRLEALLLRIAVHMGVEADGWKVRSRRCGDVSAFARDEAMSIGLARRSIREMHRAG